MKAVIEISGPDETVNAVLTTLRLIDYRCMTINITVKPDRIEKNWFGKTPMHFIHKLYSEFNLSVEKISYNIIFDVQDGFRTKDFIKLIKIVRELSGMGLKESKEWVEGYLS